MFEPDLEFRPQLLPALRQVLRQSGFEQGLPSLASFEPLLGFIQCKPAGPRREGLAWIIRVEFFPQRQRGLLHDVLRVRHVWHQRGHVAKDLPLTAQE